MELKKYEIIVETFRGVPTQLPISQLLTTLVYHTWYQINAKTYEYYLMVRLTQICKLFNLIIHEFNEIIRND